MFSEGMAKVSRNGQWGYIDMKGNIVIPLREDLKDAGYFHEGFALIKSNGKFGYIDKTGKVVIPCNFDFAQNFNEGMALVGNGVKKTFINKEGKTITDFVFDYSYTNESFSDGIMPVSPPAHFLFTKLSKPVISYNHGLLFFTTPHLLS